MENKILWLALMPVIHRIGDYLLQNTHLAVGKRYKSHLAIIHGFIYTACFVLVPWMDSMLPNITLTPLPTWKLVIIGGTHIVIDRFTLAQVWTRLLNNQLFEADATKLKCPDWVTIEVDQSMHLVINAMTILI